ncbi:MAG: hypothetical protein ACYC6N_30860 [Pirellulaceae bacterium]
MRRLVVICGLALAFLLSASPARADIHSMKVKWACFWDRVHLDWHRNNAWPEPFSLVDRQAAKAPMTIMVDKGWQLQNTIPDELFHPETQELTRAGELKVKWIVTQMPAGRRAVYVLRGATIESTDTRVKSVEKAATEVAGDISPLIGVTDLIPRGGSAAYYERVNSGFETASPPPVLPSMQEAGDSN